MAGPNEHEGQRDPAADAPPARLADDEFYLALASTPRRRVLHVLADTEEATPDELATVLGGWEATTTGRMTTATDRSAILLQLRHNHLPRLAEAGLVDYDPDAGTVQLAALHPRVTALVRESVAASQRVDPDRE